MRRNIPANHSARLDHGSFSDVDIWQDHTVWPNENIFLEDHFAVTLRPSRAPIQVRENRRPQPNRAVIADRDLFRVIVINVNEVRYPDVSSNLYPAHPLQPRAQTFPPWADERQDVKKPSEKIPNHWRMSCFRSGKDRVDTNEANSNHDINKGIGK